MKIMLPSKLEWRDFSPGAGLCRYHQRISQSSYENLRETIDAKYDQEETIVRLEDINDSPKLGYFILTLANAVYFGIALAGMVGIQYGLEHILSD